jgi:hypothetical protein
VQEVMTINPVRVLVLPSGKVDRINAANAMGRTAKTLAEWARLGVGPRPRNIGGRVFYEWDDVQAFMRGECVRPVTP